MPLDSRFLALPLELRDYVYDLLLHPNAHRTTNTEDGSIRYHYDLSLFRVNRQIYNEAKKSFRRLNTFVIIETPFPEAEHHIAIDGYVPLIKSGAIVDGFQNYHLLAEIRAPDYARSNPYKILLHLDDLEAFCRMWLYSALSYPGLNQQLSMTLHIQNPHNESQEDNPVTKALQRRLLDPFGQVKDLQKVDFKGNVYPSVRQNLCESMQEPYESMESCFEKAAAFKEEGNKAFKQDRCREAIKLWERAFEAIHIVCAGRRRSVWAESFFQGKLKGGEFDGQLANMVRLIMRVRLVANVLMAYLKLKEWEEVKFWGMRSIKLMRQAIGAEEGHDEAYLGFPAANEMGKIYYRTGLAFKELDDTPEARRLLRIAQQYLPNDEKVKAEYASVALRLG